MTGPTVSLRAALEPFAFEGVTIPRGLPLDSYWFTDSVTGKSFTVAQVLAAREALAQPVPPTEATEAREPFGYWIDQRGAEPALLRKPAYIPEPSDLRTVTPLYAAPTDATPPHDGLREHAALRFAWYLRGLPWAEVRHLVPELDHFYKYHPALSPSEVQPAGLGYAEGRTLPAGVVLTERNLDPDCGCPEEMYETPWGELHMHLSAGKASNACLDNGDEGERHIDLTTATVDEARAAIFGWANVIATDRHAEGRIAGLEEAAKVVKKLWDDEDDTSAFLALDEALAAIRAIARAGQL